MNLESLANELLVDIFEYLNIAHLFHAFYNLNHRFNQTLLTHFQLHGHINFESISKTNFDIICQQYLPTNINRINAIHLSDDIETPQQLNYFLSYGFQFQQFIYLKSLSLSYIYSEQIIKNIIIELHQLNYLTHLKIDKCQIDHDLIDDGWVFNQIWNLSKLTHCHFERKKYLWNPFFISPKILSLSIKYLYLDGFSYNSNELHCLFNHTINLENLNINIDHNYDYQKISSMILSIKKFKIFVQYSPYIINNLLKYMPNLTHLIIELAHIIIDGNQWEEIIDKYLPNLKIFHFKLEFYLRLNNDKDEQINQLLNTFHNQFWINKHQWYIQCHWYLSNKIPKACLYTLPYYYKNFPINSNIKFKSTYSNNEIHWSYDNVENLVLKNLNCNSIRFNNISNLKLHLPFNDSFWFIIPNLNRLNSLTIKLSNNVNDHLQIENLLQRTTCLYSLTLIECLVSFEFLFNLKNPSIRRLSLYDFGYFDELQCTNLIHSSLGIQCEVLLISIKNRNNILYLINEMKNLQVLNVRSQDDKWKIENNELLIEDELIEWLENFLPKTCIITRENTNNHDYIQLWIR